MAKHCVTGDWQDAYKRIHRALQASPLTINIEAGNWFSKENNYATYAQMYERAVGPDGKMVLTDNDPKNPALPRARTDDLVTIPSEWGKGHRFSQKKRLYNALNATGASNADLKKASSDMTAYPKMAGDAAKGYTTKNEKFKPRAKQVFAALNYGARPHGSSTFYGFSHMVLNPALKGNAIYFPEDTFYIAGKGTKTQAAFNTIGALLENANRGLAEAIWTSCHDLQPLPDTNDGESLVEAHLFHELKVDQDVQILVLSRQRKANEPAWTNQEWDVIVKNATAWCQLNHVRLNFASP